MVKIGEIVRQCREILAGSVENPLFESEVIISELLDIDRISIKIHSDAVVGEDDAKKIISGVKRRAMGEPVAYITGKKEFMSLEFKVTEDVLIPRPDTEILVETVIDKYSNKSVRILDMCTGSGAIACSLAEYIGNSECVGIDISKDALEVAKTNSENIGVSHKTEFHICNVLEPVDGYGMFDIVVSNPPYIESSVITTLERSVKDFEPRIALDGGESGLVFYEAIVNNIHRCLKKGGELFFEIGYNQAQSVSDIMKGCFNNIRVIKDFAGNDRVVCGQLV